MAVARAHKPANAMTLAQAHAALRSQLSPVFEQEPVALERSNGRVLAENLIAEVDLPPYDNAAMDGFAVRCADLRPDEPVTLTLVGEAAAGRPFERMLAPGEAVRILTGARLPQGAGLVVMQEVCSLEGNTLQVPGDRQRKKHWRRRGEDVSSGSQVLPAGRRLRAADAALAGSLGRRHLLVRRQLRAGLFSTGDELCEPGAVLGDGQIWDANRSLLRNLLERAGCQVLDFGILRDDPLAVEGGLSAAAHECDLLVTSGGMSVGREDHVRNIIGRRGTLDIWPLAIKPGRPVGLGDIDDCPILALPGNPTAAVVAFIAFGRSVVDVLSGASEEAPPSLILPAGCAIASKLGVREYLLASIETRDDGASVPTPCIKQGAAMLSTLSTGNGFIVLTEDRDRVRVGEFVEYVPLAPYLQ